MSATVLLHQFVGTLSTTVLGAEGTDPSSRLSMAIAGLLLLAVIVTIATVIFWRVTRPD
ncbi:MAG: hypothetical protein F2942_06090 [Actinobacteria bacterium]|uniref:Unannotated protein n=1 Tax=freshwater metagenome TaxID=449393 RepID=A0A6J7UPV1_9ZZZZ|nr:hypothetical protein [Actinomycetota bacterium]MTA74269.1 hypothetical protein [Actinomycetota bacterium]